MKKERLLIVTMLVILILLGVSTGVVHIVLDRSMLALYWNILLAGMFGIVGAELLKLFLKRMRD